MVVEANGCLISNAQRHTEIATFVRIALANDWQWGTPRRFGKYKNNIGVWSRIANTYGNRIHPAI